MNSNPPVIHVSCFLEGCNTSTGQDPFVRSIPVKRKIVVSLSGPQTDSVVASGSYKLIVNLTQLRTAGMVFNRFSTKAVVRKDARCSLTLIPCEIKFKVKFDDRNIWAKTIKKPRSIRFHAEIPDTVELLSLIILRADSVDRNHIQDCFISEWVEPTVTQRAPAIPKCHNECLTSTSGALYLYCFLKFCPDYCAEKDVKIPFVQYGSMNNICTSRNVSGHLSGQPSVRSIRSVTNSTFTLHLDTLKSYGYHFTTFRTNVTLQKNRVDDACSSTVACRVLLDDVELYNSGIGSSDREIIASVSGGTKLTLEAISTSDSECNIAVNWIDPRLTEPLPTPQFTSCNDTCLAEIDSGHIYLSCFLGVCGGTVTRSSNPPIFKLNYHQGSTLGLGYGIGANRVGPWPEGKGPIQLTDRHGVVTEFSYGIGAYPDSSMTFDLDAFRSYGYKFNSFMSTLGIDSGSGCSSKKLGSVVFYVYADGVMVLQKNLQDLTRSEIILYNVTNTSRLTLVTRKGIHRTCHHAVWAGAALVTWYLPTQ
jgi:hypothetical protein